MGLLVDPRAGSDRLVGPLRDRGLAVSAERLSSADVAWIGRGERGSPVPVGVEYKTIEEVLQCIHSGRFADSQLPLLQEDWSQAWLLVEGEWKSGRSGELLVRHGYREWRAPGYGPRKGTWMYHELEHWLMTVQTRGGIHIARAKTLLASAEWLHLCYSWWTSKDLDEHKSHLKLFEQQPHTYRVSQREVTDEVRVAAQLPGIGWEGAWAAAERFKTVEGMVGAPLDHWAKLKIGSKRQRALGERGATRVWRALHGTP